MKKIVVLMALVFSFTAVNSFAGDKDKTKPAKCATGKDCCKKMSSASATTKAKCAKQCKKDAAA
jgi:hypothetical protein